MFNAVKKLSHRAAVNTIKFRSLLRIRRYEGKLSSKSIKHGKREASIENMPVNCLFLSDPTLFSSGNLKNMFNLLMQTGLGRRCVISFQKQQDKIIEYDKEVAFRKEQQFYKDCKKLSERFLEIFNKIPTNAIYEITEEALKDVHYLYRVKMEELENATEDVLRKKEIQSRQHKALKISCLYAALNLPTELIIIEEEIVKYLATLQVGEILSRKQIIEGVHNLYGRNKSSIIPSDYCYNIVNYDIRQFQEKFRPDRRDNILLNSSIRRLVENMDEAAKDAVLGFAEFQAKPAEASAEVREVAHEIKNQLSICDLYGEIIRKYCEKNGITDETILNGVNCISRAVKISGNSLLALKSTQSKDLKQCDLKNIIKIVEDLTKVYFECKFWCSRFSGKCRDENS